MQNVIGETVSLVAGIDFSGLGKRHYNAHIHHLSFEGELCV